MPNDIPNSTWNESDAANTSPVPNGAPEGWFPSDVNNVYRMGMGATKRFWDHLNVTATTAGTSTAYMLTYAVAPQSLWAGEIFTFTVNQDCGIAPTLNINAGGDKTIRKFNGTAWVALAATDLKTDQVVSAYYNLSTQTYNIIAGIHDSPFSGGTLTTTTTMSGAAFNEAEFTIASAPTTDIGAAAGNYGHVTGTTAVTALGTIQAGTRRRVVFDGALILTHNATSLILPGGANITTAAGDSAEFESEGSGNWRLNSYQRAGETIGSLAFTPSDQSGASLTLNSVSVGYARIGNLAYVYGALTYPVNGDGSTASLSLPLPVLNQSYAGTYMACVNSLVTVQTFIHPVPGVSRFQVTDQSGSAYTNANLTGTTLAFSFFYPVI